VEVEELTDCIYRGEELWVGGSGGAIGRKSDEEWTWVSVPELGIRVEVLAIVSDVIWTMGTATKILGPFLDYPSWISPETADEPLIGELSWELPGPIPPEFTQISFTPCQTYIPWYFLVDGLDTSTYLANFSEEGLTPSTYLGYMMYLNHRRSNVPFDIDHFVMAVDLQNERVEAQSSLSSLSSNCFF